MYLACMITVLTIGQWVTVFCAAITSPEQTNYRVGSERAIQFSYVGLPSTWCSTRTWKFDRD